jgi:ribonuclease HI
MKVYTDGGYHHSTGVGGWAIVTDSGIEKSGAEINTTSNRMELKAAIEAIKLAYRFKDIEVVTDSQYVKNGITSWIKSWKKNGWKTSNKTPVKNKDLWEELDKLCESKLDLKWSWTRGHNGDVLNERCDELNQAAIKELE